MRRTTKLWAHTWVAVVLVCCFVLAPAILLVDAFGEPGKLLAVALFGIGTSCLIAAVALRMIQAENCSKLQRYAIASSAWLFSPVAIAAAGANVEVAEGLVCWSGMPLAAALALCTLRLQLIEGDPDWLREPCPPRPSTITTWLFSRMVALGIPLCLVSFQITLWLPEDRLIPGDAQLGLFVCGAFVLIGAKFCTMCAALQEQKCHQVGVLLLLLLGDWLSCMNLLRLTRSEAKVHTLLLLLLLAGCIQAQAAFTRLRLRSRWSREMAIRRARGRDQDLQNEVELGTRIDGDQQEADSDSDAEIDASTRLPDSFYEALLCVFGISPPARPPRRFLCPCRRATRPPAEERSAADPEAGTSMVTLSSGGKHNMAIGFRAQDGVLHEIVFTQKPLGLEYLKKAPIVIEQVRPNGHGEALGVQVGWEVAAINGEDLTACGFDHVNFRMRAAVNLLATEQSLEEASSAITASVAAGNAVGEQGSVTAGSSSSSSASLSTSSNASFTSTGSRALEVPQNGRLCTICQDDIEDGDEVRPLPKCAHIFHASCLDRWATTMRESTVCPTCRRPALARKAEDGSVNISSLAADEPPPRPTRPSVQRSASAGSRPLTRRTGSGRGRTLSASQGRVRTVRRTT